MYNRFTFDVFLEKLKENGYTYISGDYGNIYSKVTIKDEEGFLYYTNLNNIIYGSTPRRVNRFNKYSLHNIQRIFNTLDLKLTITSTEYTGNTKELKFTCNVCNRPGVSTYNSLLYSKGCPKCGYDSKGGAYCPTIVNRNKDKYKKMKGILYVVKCFNELEMFYKIGVTSRSVSERFRNKREMPYNIEVVIEVDSNMYTSVIIEAELHNLHKDNKYKPKIPFEGCTECFTSINMRILNNYKETYHEKQNVHTE